MAPASGRRAAPLVPRPRPPSAPQERRGAGDGRLRIKSPARAPWGTRPPVQPAAAMASWNSVALALIAAALLAVAHADTACQRARVRDQRNSNPYVIHECDAEGNYVAKQKTVGTPHWYWCYTPDGDVITGPSRKIETCACPTQMHRVREANRANRKSDPEPVCANTGHFVPLQSDASHKWCVNKDTGAVTKQRVPQSQTLTC